MKNRVNKYIQVHSAYIFFNKNNFPWYLYKGNQKSVQSNENDHMLKMGI